MFSDCLWVKQLANTYQLLCVVSSGPDYHTFLNCSAVRQNDKSCLQGDSESLEEREMVVRVQGHPPTLARMESHFKEEKTCKPGLEWDWGPYEPKA